MKIEKDDHDGYAKVGKTIYGEEDPRRWSDRCRCGGTRADHVIINQADLGRPTTAHVSDSNVRGVICQQFIPDGTPFFPNLKVVKDSEPNPNSVKIEGGQ